MNKMNRTCICKDKILDAFQCGKDPKVLLAELFNVDPADLPNDEGLLWHQLIQTAYEPVNNPISGNGSINSFHRVLNFLNNSKKIVVILGAGGSVGPDFRSPGGLYDSIARSGELEDPMNIFNLSTYNQDSSIFWRFAKMIFPSRHPEHSVAHYFLQELASRGKLLRLYSQNVDSLEIGIPQSSLRCVHGSWRENICQKCSTIHTIEDIRPYVEIGVCPICKICGGEIKPGIIFFGQDIHLNTFELENDAKDCDLLIVIGTSLQVQPVSLIPSIMNHIPSILINRGLVAHDFSAELLGECDTVISMIQGELGWEEEVDTKPSDILFYPPNKLIFPPESPFSTRIEETSCNSFLVTSSSVSINDLL